MWYPPPPMRSTAAKFPEAIKVLLRHGTLSRIDKAASRQGLSRAALLRAAIADGIAWGDNAPPGALPRREYPEQVFIPLPTGWKSRIEKEAARDRINRSEWIRRQMEQAIQTINMRHATEGGSTEADR